ncbi:MAG: ROK family protein [Sciscionella sp.]
MTMHEQRGSLGPADMRLANEWSVLSYLREHGAVSASSAAAATGLSRPTANSALASLQSSGLAAPSGIRTGNAGRAPRLWTPRYDAGWVISVDVGVEWVRLALADLSGTLHDRRRAPSADSDAAGLIAQIGTMVTELARDNGLPTEDILSITIGSPGSYDPREKRLRLAPNLPMWERSAVVDRLAELLGDVVQLENDIDLAAVGEQAAGAGRGVTDFAYLSVGHGVGMGLVLGGKLHRGGHGTAGEVGFLPLGEVDDVPSAKVRHRGMLEAATASDALLAHARKRGLRRVRSPEQLFEVARGGDGTALEVVRREAQLLARGLAAVIVLVDPQLVVLGGGVGRNGGDLLLPPLREHLENLLPLPLPQLTVSTAGDDATLTGGVALATQVAWPRAVRRTAKP